MPKNNKQFELKSLFQKDILLMGCIIILLIIIMYLFGKSQSFILGTNQVQRLTPTIALPTETPMPKSPTPNSANVDPDPVVNCGPGVNSKQYVKDRASNCKNYVDCGLSGNTVYTLMLNTECEKKHAEENSKKNANNYPPCTVNWKYSGTTTYNNLTIRQCEYYQNLATNPSQNETLNLPKFELSPFPTVKPYEYSQEYLDSLNKANQVFNEPWKPSQFTPPTTKCYSSWAEYFAAHPNYAPQNITEMSGTPPCD